MGCSKSALVDNLEQESRNRPYGRSRSTWLDPQRDARSGVRMLDEYTRKYREIAVYRKPHRTI